MERPKDIVKPAAAESERSEYSFEEGVDEAFRRISAIAKREKRDVLVVINGSATNVGKSKLRSEIGKKLIEAGLSMGSLTSDSREEFDRDRARQGKIQGTVVYFLEKQGTVDHSTEQYRMGTGAGTGFVSVDLYIGIYRPDKPFEEIGGLSPVADMMIRNEKAHDDSGKHGAI